MSEVIHLENKRELFVDHYFANDFNGTALKLHHPTPADIDLSNYRIVRWSNGSTSSSQDINYTQPLTGTINAKSTFLAALDKRDPFGTGMDTMLFQELQDTLALYDHAFYSPDYSSNAHGAKCMYFNGDDAITLEKTSDGGTTYNIIDIFGLIGEHPQTSTGSYGAGWTDQPNYWDGQGDYWTRDQTLTRKSSVESGATTIYL